MRLLFILICSLLFSFHSLAQSLSFKDLLKFQNATQAEMNLKLTRKGWTFLSDQKPIDNLLGKAVWAYNPTEEGATTWCILYYSESTPNRILYNITEGTTIVRIRKKINNNAKQVLEEESKIERESYIRSIADYENDLYVFRLYTYTQPDYVGVKVFNKVDYLKAKELRKL